MARTLHLHVSSTCHNGAVKQTQSVALVVNGRATIHFDSGRLFLASCLGNYFKKEKKKKRNMKSQNTNRLIGGKHATEFPEENENGRYTQVCPVFQETTSCLKHSPRHIGMTSQIC